MKKINISQILYVFLLIIVLSFFCSLYDNFNNKKLYNSNYEFQNSKNINISANIYIDSNIIKKIKNIADNNNIILEKIVTKDNKITYHYLNFCNYDKIYKLFNIRSNTNKPVTTISNYDKSKYYIKKDFLNNDFHTFLLFDDLYKNETNYNGEYNIYYNNINDYDSFLKNILELLGVNEKELLSNGHSLNKNNFQIEKKYYIIISIVLLILIILTSLFYCLKKSNNIGIYRLNGFSNRKIIKYNVFYDLKNDITITIIIFTIFSLILNNNCLIFVLLSSLICCLILLIKILISIICTYKISKSINISNLIKKVQVTDKLIKFNMFFKILSFSILLVLILFVSFQYKIYNNRKKEINNFMKYSNYAVFSQFYIGNDLESFTGGSNELDESEFKLYKYLENFDVVYADFRNFATESQEEKNAFNIPTKNGNKRFKYGTIDTNYLADLKLVNYQTHEFINISKEEKNNIFLIPESLSNEVNNFKNFYYEYYDEKENDQFIIYEDKKIPTLSLNIAYNDHYLIDSPILKVITPNNISVRMVSVYGVGFDTPLKVKVDTKNKSIFFDKIEPKLVELNLDDNLNINTFFTYEELFSNELNSISKQLNIFIILLILLILIYIYISLQNIVLHIKNKFKEISIKKLNGWSNFRIFNDYIFNMVIVNILISIIIIGFSLKKFEIAEIFIFLIIINLLEFLINYIIIKIKLKNFIVNAIKGDEI